MTANLPKTDSIKELASFWDTHDLTDFDDELEEVTEPVFERKGSVVRVPLTDDQARALDTLAQSRGIDASSLILEWVEQNIQSSS